MRRDEVLRLLAQQREKLRDFHVGSLSIFGSVARDEASDVSDVDVLVEFEEGAVVGLFEFVRLQRFLIETLGCNVDLATPDSIRQAMRQRVMKEAIRVA